jgi:hypothetical protein
VPGGAVMGFALELANAGDFGMPDAWDFPPSAPRHRKPRRHGPAAAALARDAVTVAAAAARRARFLIVNHPALADHRRAF